MSNIKSFVQIPPDEKVPEVTGAFFIFDNMIESETAEPGECALFFHPSSLPVNLQSFLLGYVSAMAVFVEGFGSSLSVIQLQRSKMAVKKVDGITMVLVGRKSESDLAVRQHLDDIFNAFCFFFGSFGSMLAAHANSSRAELLKAMRRVGEELLPLVENYCSTPFSSFDPLPFTALRPHTGRVVLRASQLLQSVSSLNGHLGGAIFCSIPGLSGLCSLVATALPVEVTRWMAARVTHVSDSMALGGGVGRGDDLLLNSQCDLLNVMISTSLRDQLKSESSRRQPLIQPEDWCRAPPLSATASSSSLPVVLSGAELAIALTLPEPSPGHCFAGLLIVYMGSLAACLLMELDQLYDQQHMQEVRRLCDLRLLALETEMRVLNCLPSGSSSSSDSVDSDTVLVMCPSSASGAALTASAASAGSGAVASVSDRSSLSSSAPLLSHSSSLGELPLSPAAFKTSTTPSSLRGRRSLPTDRASQSQHWVFVHDASTGWAIASATGTGQVAAAMHNELLVQANFVHDIFSKSPSTHQLSLRTADRSYFCKRVGKKEIYLMQSPASFSCFDIEQDAKRILFEEYGMRIL